MQVTLCTSKWLPSIGITIYVGTRSIRSRSRVGMESKTHRTAAHGRSKRTDKTRPAARPTPDVRRPMDAAWFDLLIFICILISFCGRIMPIELSIS